MSELGSALFSTPEMAAIFSETSRLQRMLDFEAALARAEARAGLVPPEAAEAIGECCRAELFDVAALHTDAVSTGIPAIPVVKALTSLVPAEARGYVHWGATSQDVIDTGLVLQMRHGLDLLIEQLSAVASAAAALAEHHRHTAMPGRTLLQQALPITFGLKAAHWVTVATRGIARMRVLKSSALRLQFGGAAGTLAALGEVGPVVAEALGEELGLLVPELPWHTDRDRVAVIAAAVGITSGALAKVASDVALLMQTEVGEATEGSAGGSSTMPHKRNPVAAPEALAAARLALGGASVVMTSMVQEHERGVGGWHAEWVAVPDVFRYASGTVAHVAAILGSLEVDPDRMGANLSITEGQIMAESLMMALAPHIGRDEAYSVVKEASGKAAAKGVGLQEAAGDDERITGALTGEELRAAFDPAAYLGSADLFITRALEGYAEVAAGDG